MGSPNEPGYPRAGEGPDGANGPNNGPGANGSAGNHQSLGPRPGGDSGDVPPWQRGPAARAAQPGPRPAEPRRAPRGDDDHSPGVDARLNRFVGGGGATPTEEVPVRERQDAPRSEAYASELPDLSGPMPRPQQQQPPRKPAERSGGEPARPAAGSRVQVGTRHKGPVRASMQIRRVDPWSTLKVSLLLSVALFFVWMIAVAFLYLVLGGMGVWSKLNSNVGDLLTSAGGGAGGELVSSGTIFGGAALIGLVNIVLLTAMATIGAFIYNLSTDLVGGVEVTLADRD
ncbi:Transmembrane protein of unknown function [Mycolicibacterium rutilum]|uniref:DUF3566 domain-containing protein n=1 Tax=Mycolicibacterium rutilum TaxID=370526 RepID=A0A1H6J4T8_MYCRU|nr:DUF3566 domain-containing protein [Mycolicibacterium rutilum]SEH55719.1 Transmembrane protein of unknown function [Mycolicibacterium rutilum]